MAAIVDWHIDAPLNVENYLFGIYNKFQATITSDSGAVFNLKYRIRLTGLAGITEIVKDVDPIDGAITLNPFESAKGYMSVIENSPSITIQIGEVFAAVEDDPPTFQGYDVTKSISFYNGYAYTENVNYIEPGWEVVYGLGFLPKLPVVKGQDSDYPDKIGESDERIVNAVAFFGDLSSSTNKYSTFYINWEFKDVNGSVIDSGQELSGGIVGRMAGVNVGTTGSITYPVNWHTLEVWYQYRIGETASYTPSQRAYFIKEVCPTYKYDRFRLRWYNRFSAYEYQNFWMKSNYVMNWEKGKEIRTDGIDRPELIEYGKSGTTEYELNSGWLTEQEQLALRELYESPRVTMFDGENNEYDVIVQDNSYKVEDIRNGLFKVTVRLKLARMNKARIQ